METTDTDLSCGSLTGNAYADPAAASTNGSAPNLRSDQARETTPTAGPMLIALEVELSILQRSIEQFIAMGGTVRSVPQRTPNGAPVLTLQIHGAMQCPTCRFWTMLSQCQNEGCNQ